MKWGGGPNCCFIPVMLSFYQVKRLEVLISHNDMVGYWCSLKSGERKSSCGRDSLEVLLLWFYFYKSSSRVLVAVFFNAALWEVDWEKCRVYILGSMWSLLFFSNPCFDGVDLTEFTKVILKLKHGIYKLSNIF